MLVNAPPEIEMLFELANMDMADLVGFKRSVGAGAALRSGRFISSEWPRGNVCEYCRQDV